MGLINEGGNAGLNAALVAGIESLSRNQTVTFRQYVKYVMPQDDYVFWVSNGETLVVKGSLHEFSDRRQDEDQTIGAAKMLFTSEVELDQFSVIDPTTMWVGCDGNIQIVFSEGGGFYLQAGIWHYSGYAVYPALANLLVNSASDLPTAPIVSNSLPIWLAQNTFAPVYSSYLVPDNVKPPYVVAHITPEDTEALGAFPIYQNPTAWTIGINHLPSSQLMKDKVRLTLYGFTNQLAIQYFSSLIDYSRNTDDFGFCNSPAIKDEKRTQVEIAAIAMKKTINIIASYYQGTADAIQRRLILSASITTNV